MKKIILMSLLSVLTLGSQTQCSVGSNVKLFGKNLGKTIIYGAGTAVLSAVSIGAYMNAAGLNAQAFPLKLARVVSLITGDVDSFMGLSQSINVAENFQPVLYGISAAFSIPAAYSLFKAVQSTYKTVTFEE